MGAATEIRSCTVCQKSTAILFPPAECECVGGRLAVCVRMIVSQLVRPHNSSCVLGQLNKAFGDTLLLCGNIEQNAELIKGRLRTPNNTDSESNPDMRDRILLSGDIESNPGPPRRSVAQKGPTTEEKVESISATMATYEAKISGLENEIEGQKEKFETSLEDILQRLTVLESKIDDMGKDNKEKEDERAQSFTQNLEKLQEESKEKISEITDKIGTLSEKLESDTENQYEKFKKVEDNFNALQSALKEIQSDNHEKLDRIVDETRKGKDVMNWLEGKVKDSKVEYTGKIHEIAHVAREQRREYKSKFLDVDTEYTRLRERMESMNHMLDDVQEKLYEFEQNKKNNLIFHGIVPEHPENADSLTNRITSILKTNISIKRDLPIAKASRIYTGPEVRGVRPVLVTFENFKDRDEVLRKARMLKRANIHVEEDLSKRTRENREYLRKFMRQVRKANPEKNCFLQYDKLYIDSKVYVYNEALGSVVEHTESVRFAEMMSRPGSALMGPMVGMYMNSSRPGSRTGSRPASGIGQRMDPGSSIPKLPPLNKGQSMSLPSIADYVDPRDVKMNELEKVINQYQEKLNNVTSNYQQKIGILENTIIEKELERSYAGTDIRDEYEDGPLDMSPERNPRTPHKSPTKSAIDVIREEDEMEDERLEINGTHNF